MDIPKRAENIYPTTEENIKYVLLYYFPNMPHSKINEEAQKIHERRGLTLNQVEFVAKIVSENLDYLKGYLYGRIHSLDIVFRQGSEAIYGFPGQGGEKDKEEFKRFRDHLNNKYQ